MNVLASEILSVALTLPVHRINELLPPYPGEQPLPTADYTTLAQQWQVMGPLAERIISGKTYQIVNPSYSQSDTFTTATTGTAVDARPLGVSRFALQVVKTAGSKEVEQFKGERCFIGEDLASKIDVAAKIRIFERGDRLRAAQPQHAVDAVDAQARFLATKHRLLPATYEMLDDALRRAGQVARALSKDPASVHVRITTIYGTIEVARTAPGTNSPAHAIGADGTITVK